MDMPGLIFLGPLSCQRLATISPRVVGLHVWSEELAQLLCSPLFPVLAPLLAKVVGTDELCVDLYIHIYSDGAGLVCAARVLVAIAR